MHYLWIFLFITTQRYLHNSWLVGFVAGKQYYAGRIISLFSKLHACWNIKKIFMSLYNIIYYYFKWYYAINGDIIHESRWFLLNVFTSVIHFHLA